MHAPTTLMAAVASVLLVAAPGCHVGLQVGLGPVPEDGGARDAGAPPEESPPSGEPGIARLGESCSTDDLRACSGHASIQPLVCNAGEWQLESPCDSDERCDTTAGDDQGRCRPIAPECEDHEPGEPFCAGDVLRTCPDLVAAIDERCPEHARCTEVAGAHRCECKLGYRAGDRAGDDAAVCVPIAPECVGRAPDARFCAGNAVRSCVDQLAFVDELCMEHAVCSGAGSTTACVCEAGWRLAQRECVDVDECELDRGGCDALSECINTSGGHGCGPCPEGYAGDGETGCEPRLTELAIAGSVLRPAFDPETTSYAATLRWNAQSLDVIASAPIGTEIEVDGRPAAAGTVTVPTPGLARPPSLEVVASAGERPERAYDVTLMRGASAYIKSIDPGGSEHFGTSVAVSGDTLVAGSYATAAAYTVHMTGAAQVFVRDTDGWHAQSRLVGSNSETVDCDASTCGDAFGKSVAISGDTIVAGAPHEDGAVTHVALGNPHDNTATDSGAVYVFVRSGATWTEQARLKASNAEAHDGFGEVAISGDTIVVGAPHEDSAATSGNSASPGQADNSATSCGAAYVFVRSAGAWTQRAYLKGSLGGVGTRFGHSVAISGDTIVVGAPSTEPAIAAMAYVFVRAGDGTWSEQARLTGAISSGLTDFGSSVAIAEDTIVVGESGSYSAVPGAYVFVRTADAWTLQAHLNQDQNGSVLGGSVAISGDRIVLGDAADSTSARGVSSDFDARETALESGAAYSFVRSGSNWALEAYFKADNSEPYDAYGASVAVAGDVIAIGAPNEAGPGRGVSAIADDANEANESGAVYVY
jgi:hypothetical protein